VVTFAHSKELSASRHVLSGGRALNTAYSIQNSRESKHRVVSKLQRQWSPEQILVGSNAPIQTTRVIRCHTRRSIARFTSSPAVLWRKSFLRACIVLVPCVAPVTIRRRPTTTVGSLERYPSASVQP